MTNEELIQRATALLNEQRVPATNANLSRAIEALSRAGQSLDSTTRNMDDVYERMTRANAILDNVPGVSTYRVTHSTSRTPSPDGTSHYTTKSTTSQVRPSTSSSTPDRAAELPERQQTSQSTKPQVPQTQPVQQPASTSVRNTDNESSPSERREVDEATETYAPQSRREVGTSDTGNPLDAILAAALGMSAKSAYDSYSATRPRSGDFIPGSPQTDVERAAIEQAPIEGEVSRTRIPYDPRQLAQQRLLEQQRSLAGPQTIDDVLNEALGATPRHQLGQPTDMQSETRSVIEAPDESKLSVQHGVPTERRGNVTQSPRRPDVIELGADERPVQQTVVDEPALTKSQMSTSAKQMQPFMNDVWDAIGLSSERRPGKQAPQTLMDTQRMQDTASKLLAENKTAKAKAATTAKSTADSVVDNAVEQSKATDEASQQKAKRPRSVSDNKERVNKLIGDVKDSIGAVDVEVVPGKRGTSRGYFQVTDSRGNILGKYYSAQEMRAAIKDGSLNEAYNAAKSAVGAAAKAVRGIKK